MKKSLVAAATDAAHSRANIADANVARSVLATPIRKELKARTADIATTALLSTPCSSNSRLSSLTVSVLKEKCKKLGIKHSGLRKADLVVALSAFPCIDEMTEQSPKNLASLTVSELRGKCKGLDIDHRGLRKADLVLRLEECLGCSSNALSTVEEENRPSVAEGVSVILPSSKDISSLTVTELRGKCKSLDIDHRGLRKADLVVRLEEHMGISQITLTKVDEEGESSLQNENISVSFQSMKVKELKEQCKFRGLSCSGLKQHLIDRLEKYDIDSRVR
jgi:hypothetical protein